VGGWSVVTAAALMSAYPPTRLPAQAAAGVALLPGSARSEGLAGAGVALGGDAGSMFANPAGIARIHRYSLGASYEWYPGVTLSSGAAALRVGRFDYGIGGQLLRPAATESPDLLGLSAIVYRFGMVAVGTSVKYVRQGPAAPQNEIWAADAGLAIALFDIFALGLSVQNLDIDSGAGAHLPRRTRFGITMNYVDPQGAVRLLTTLEGQWLEGRSAVLVAGAEGGIVLGGVGVIGRVGVSGQSSSDASPIALGAAVSFGRLQIDYAYRSYDAPSGVVHRFGLRWVR
jgi:hypothetical protein